MEGTLEVTIAHPLAMIARFHPMARLLRMGPRIAIDGEVVSRDYRAASLALPAGTHRLEIWISWLIFPRAHHAAQSIEIVAGETVAARYYAAKTRNGPGRIEIGAPLPKARVSR